MKRGAGLACQHLLEGVTVWDVVCMPGWGQTRWEGQWGRETGDEPLEGWVWCTTFLHQQLQTVGKGLLEFTADLHAIPTHAVIELIAMRNIGYKANGQSC